MTAKALIILFFILFSIVNVHGSYCTRISGRLGDCVFNCCRSNSSCYSLLTKNFLNETYNSTINGICLEPTPQHTTSTTQYEWCTSTNQCSNEEVCYIRPFFKSPGICVPCTMLKEQDENSIYFDTSKCDSRYTEHKYINDVQPGSSCNNSLKCAMGSPCLGLLTNGSLASCNGNIGNNSFETPCFCYRENYECEAGDLYDEYFCNKDFFRQCGRYAGCPLSRVCADIPYSDYGNYLVDDPLLSGCVPCSWISVTRNWGFLNDCNINYEKPIPPISRKSNIGEACMYNFRDDCSNDLVCRQLDIPDKVILQDCPSSYGPPYLDGPSPPTDCFCFLSPWTLTSCNPFNPCRNGTCIDFNKKNRQYCISNDVIRENSILFENFQPVIVFPEEILVYLFIVVIISSVLKSVFMQNQSRYGPHIVIFSLIVESLADLALTTLQAVSVFFDSDSGFLSAWNYDVDGFIAAAALFIISAATVITLELRYVLIRVTKAGKLSSPPNREWNILGEMTIFSSITLLLFSAIKLREIENIDSHSWRHLLLVRLLFVGFILIYIVILYAILCKKIKQAYLLNVTIRKKTLIVWCLGTLFFIGISILAILDRSLFPHYCPDRPVRFNILDSHDGVAVAVFMLPLHIIAIAICTIGMYSANNSKVSRTRKFIFLLFTFVGMSGPGIVITTSTMCWRDIRNILMVAYSQVIVLVFPILLELITPKLSRVATDVEGKTQG